MSEKVDVSKLREGDVVTIVGTLVQGDFDIVWKLGNPTFSGEWFGLKTIEKHIVSVEPRPLKVGDRVTRPGNGVSWEIIATAEGHALIKNGEYVAHEILSDLERAS